MSRMDIPILDYTATYLVNNPVEAAAQPQPWSDMVVQDAKDAAGYLSKTESRPAVGRRLMQAAGSAADPPTVNNLPVSPLPAPVYATTSGHGSDARMLPHDPALNPELLAVFPTPACTGMSVYLAAGMDVCSGSPVQKFPDGSPVAGAPFSVLVPPGLRLALTDACEYSQPVGPSGAFDYGTVLATFDNSASGAAQCWPVPAATARRGRTLRVLAPPGAASSPRYSVISYRVLADGRTQVIGTST